MNLILTKGVIRYVMDNCCYTRDLMAAWFFNIYRWWVNTHSIGNCADCGCSTVASRQKSIKLIEAEGM